MPLHLTPHNSPSPEPVESHLNEPVEHTASTSHLSSASSHQPAETSSSETPNLADQFSAIPENSTSSSKKRPAEEEAGPDESAKRQKTEAGSQGHDLPSFLNTLHGQGGGSALYKHLDVPDLVSMNQASKPMHSAIQQGTILPNLQGRRTVEDPNNPAAGKQHFYSTDPAGKQNRYFKPMSAAGETSNLPHISEQAGHTPHISDVAQMHYPAPNKNLQAGNYPAKVQFPIQNGTAGQIDIPAKPNKGRVFTPAPPAANEPPGTYVETKMYNQALRGQLGQGAQRLPLTNEQAAQSASAVQNRFEGKTVSGKDK